MIREADQYIGRLEGQGHVAAAYIFREAKLRAAQLGDLPESLEAEEEEKQGKVLHHSLFDFDRTGNLITRDGKSEELTQTEADVLAQLMKSPNIRVSYRQIYENVFGYTNVDNTSELSKSHVSNIRRKMRGIGVNGEEVILAFPGLGYLIRDLELQEEEVIPEPKKGRVIRHPYFSYYPDRQVVVELGSTQETFLTAMESRLLEELFRNLDRLTSFDRLESVAWPDDTEMPLNFARLVRTHVSHLRAKIQKGLNLDEGLSLIVSKNSVGYKLTSQPEYRTNAGLQQGLSERN